MWALAIDTIAIGAWRIPHVIAPPGSGKSVTIFQLVDYWKKYAHEPLVMHIDAASMGISEALTQALLEDDRYASYVEAEVQELLPRRRTPSKKDIQNTKMLLLQQMLVDEANKSPDGMAYIDKTIISFLDEATVASKTFILKGASLVEESLLRELALSHLPGQRVTLKVKRAILVTASQPSTIYNVLPLGEDLRDDNVAHRVVMTVILNFTRQAKLENMRARHYYIEYRRESVISRLKGFFGDKKERNEAIKAANVKLTEEDTKLFINIMPSRRIRALMGAKAYIYSALDEDLGEIFRRYVLSRIYEIAQRGYIYEGYSRARYNSKYLRTLSMMWAPVMTLDEMAFIAGLTNWGEDAKRSLEEAVNNKALRVTAMRKGKKHYIAYELDPSLAYLAYMLIKYFPTGEIARERGREYIERLRREKAVDTNILAAIDEVMNYINPARLE